MTDEQYIEDLKAFIKADLVHLHTALADKQRHEAHGCVDAIIDNTHELERMLRKEATA